MFDLRQQPFGQALVFTRIDPGLYESCNGAWRVVSREAAQRRGWSPEEAEPPDGVVGEVVDVHDQAASDE